MVALKMFMYKWASPSISCAIVLNVSPAFTVYVVAPAVDEGGAGVFMALISATMSWTNQESS